MVNPCFCGCSLKTATLVISIIDMIVAGFSAVTILVLGYVAIQNALAEGTLFEANSEVAQHDEILYGSSVEVIAAIFGGSLLLCVMRFYFALVLQRGSDQEDVRRCKIWMVSACFFLLISIGAIFANYFRQQEAFENVGQVIGIIYFVLSMWVVYEFIKEVQASKTSRTNSFV